jgi:hypothetical protein
MRMLDPATEDWTKMSDSQVYWAAVDRIPQTLAEYRRRRLDEPASEERLEDL